MAGSEASSGPGATGPLAGLRVLDLTRLLPGPVCTLYLADLGADVVKIEDTGAGDYARSLGNPPGTVSAFFRAVNRNKRAVTLDLRKPDGQALFLKLLPRFDVLIENYRPGTLERLDSELNTSTLSSPPPSAARVRASPARSRAAQEVAATMNA